METLQVKKLKTGKSEPSLQRSRPGLRERSFTLSSPKSPASYDFLLRRPSVILATQFEVRRVGVCVCFLLVVALFY